MYRGLSFDHVLSEYGAKNLFYLLIFSLDNVTEVSQMEKQVSGKSYLRKLIKPTLYQ